MIILLLFAILAYAILTLAPFGTKLASDKGGEKRAVVKKEEMNYQILEKYVPAAAADYCVDLWKLYNFTLKIKGSRKTKLGDFRVDRSGNEVAISVNGTLNQYAFLVTYLHEVAHLITWQKHRSKVKPHGIEWQTNFQLLMQPLLTTEFFPDDLLRVLKKYMQAPAASSASFQPLWLALRSFDEQTGENTLLLSQVPNGNKFRFSDNVYLKVEVRRTRALCHNVSNGRRYLISTAAQVELVA